MFELENGDVLIYHFQTHRADSGSHVQTTPQQFEMEFTVKLLDCNGKKFYALVRPDLRRIYDQNGLLIAEDNFTIPNIEIHQRFYYKSPMNYKCTLTEISNVLDFAKKSLLDVTENYVKAYAHVSTSRGEVMYKGEGTIYGIGGDLIPTTLTWKKYNCVSVSDSDFAPLFPFKEGKTLILKNPVSFKVLVKSCSVGAQLWTSHRVASGDFCLKITLKKKVPYQIAEKVNVDAYEFEYVGRKFRKNTVDGKLTGELSFEIKATGKVAFVGFPLIVECKSVSYGSGKSYGGTPLPTTKSQLIIEYYVKMERAKKRTPLEKVDINELLPAVEEFENEILNTVKDVEALGEKAPSKPKLKKPRKPKLTKPIELPRKKKVEPIDAAQERVKEAVKEIHKESFQPTITHEKVIEKALEEFSPSAFEEETQEFTHPREILKPVEDVYLLPIKNVKKNLMRRIKTGDDLVEFFELNKNALQVDPIVRKGFLSYLKDMLKLEDEIIDEELCAPINELIDKPIDYVEDILRDSGFSEEFQRVRESLDKWDLEKQRERDIARINRELVKVGKEYLAELIRHDKAWKMMIDKLEGTMEDERYELLTSPFTTSLEVLKKNLLEVLKKNPEDFPKTLFDNVMENIDEGIEIFQRYLDIAESIAIGSKLLLSASKLLVLHNRIVDLRNKLKLVREGILINPSLEEDF
ncbi:MAG: hypothetical protein ACTSSJ_07795 [Candidatus Odinarchaeia archaeon]